jgi:hypothetical protein
MQGSRGYDSGPMKLFKDVIAPTGRGGTSCSIGGGQGNFGRDPGLPVERR